MDFFIVTVKVLNSYDGTILEKEERWDNAMCHYAFSAECFIKVLYAQMSDKSGKKLGHRMEEAYASLTQYYSFIRMHDVTTDIMLGETSLPTRLFENHPERRYWDDISYTREEVRETRELVSRMMQELLIQLLAGRVFLDGKFCACN